MMCSDGGASIFAETIREIRKRTPSASIEVLIPDFQGKAEPLYAVLDAGPDILNHNTETVPRLYRLARSGGRYERTLELLDRSRTYAPRIATKSGIMLGLGEEWDEIVATLRDLRTAGCAILTLGQYLRPSAAHLPMTRYYHPDEFRELKEIALEMGFTHVESGPLVRSSYHAHEQADALQAAGASAVGGRAWWLSGSAGSVTQPRFITTSLRARDASGCATYCARDRARETGGVPQRHLLGEDRFRDSAIRMRAC